MSVKRRAFRVSAKFYIILLSIAVAVTGIVLYGVRPGTAIAEAGVINFNAVFPAVVVRDEEVIAAESYGKAEYLVPDQQRVEAETPVVNVYRWGYNEKVMDDLVDVRAKILQYESANENPSVSGLRTINEQIDNITQLIQNAAAGYTDGADVIALEGQLRELMTERAEYLKDNAPNDQQLEEYRKQEQQLEERVGSWRDTWESAEAGVISYYFDGYEPVLNADTIRTSSVAQVRQILEGSLPIAQVADGTAPLYRLVNNFEWYIVIPSKDPILEFANDNTFSVVFSEYPDRQFEGTVIGHIVEGEDHLYVVEFSEDIGSLVNTRRVSASLSAAFEGMLVPDKSVKNIDGQTGVYVLVDKARTFVPVTVQAEEDGRVIVVPADDTTLLTEGARVET